MLSIDYLDSLIGQNNSSKLLMAINAIGCLGIMVILKELEPNYVTLSIQYGFILLLDSQRSQYVYESQYDALMMAVIGGLNAIGYFTLFAALRKIDLLVIMLVFNFKTLFVHSIQFQNNLSSILFLFGFTLNLMSNDRILAVWALVFGQACQTGSGIIQQRYRFHNQNLQLYKGAFMIMMSLFNFGFYSDKIENSFLVYIASFPVLITYTFFQWLPQEVKLPNEMAENAIIGIQLLVLLLHHSFKILPTISCIFYFLGIFSMFIKK
ncbi:unnamed protein product (macronuclear) [Paramecium tetraurelia]|uniref:Uncharacterized protein n=1 Tax=Paramecium tetraurelia TaxID=5888 RepID=A0C3X4_PARTE|nr:uncharacterized protein GSPATT00034970001 [Paramecium tetraurelia]CAK65491.1 unnamed protein product [Paramecium tetraurelia]|eukprot:XP_001432888.1 hypothetical protein (macronuclear) [Paramecium tetraurelia strain d4-2]